MESRRPPLLDGRLWTRPKCELATSENSHILSACRSTSGLMAVMSYYRSYIARNQFILIELGSNGLEAG